MARIITIDLFPRNCTYELNSGRIKKNVSELIIPGIDLPYSVRLSMGVGTVDKETNTTLDNALKKADIAMYKAKDCGRDCWVV